MKQKLFTYVFCTFVFSQVFNYFNCRKIGQREINVFERIFVKPNPYFWLSIAFVSFFLFISETSFPSQVTKGKMVEFMYELIDFVQISNTNKN